MFSYRNLIFSFFIFCAAVLGVHPAGGITPVLNLEPDLALATAQWLPGNKAPAPFLARDKQGLVFNCPLKSDLERVYWDRGVKLNLNDYPVIELEITCSNPAVVRRLGFYLKSGKGWYVWLVPVPGGGRQKIVLRQKDAGTEGRPSGWHQIDGMRLSVMPANKGDTSLILHALNASFPAIAVVRGTVSAPNQAERNAANSAARRIGRWLTSLSLSHVLLDDQDLNSAKLAGTRLIILPYNPEPSREQLQVLNSFLKRGGKLIVFYSAEPRLASLMGVRLGEYQRAPYPGRWSSMQFNADAPPYVPPCVYQESSNIRPVYPARAKSKVIAWWRNAEGMVADDPAWVQTETGFWMSHVLLDGDDENKKLMLLALIGQCAPTIWRDAALAALPQIGHVGPYHNLDRLIADVTKQADKRGRKVSSTKAHLRKAQEHYNAVHRSMLRQDYPQAFAQSRKTKQLLTQAYASVQPVRRGEFRGVWNHSGLGLYPGDWQRTCRFLKQHGFNAVFPNFLWAGTAFYPSRILPQASISLPFGNQLAQAAAAAGSADLELHLWKVCWNLGPVPAELMEQYKRDGRLQRTSDGTTLPWLCPSQRKNVEQELGAIREAASTGLLAGIHLDYLRYPGRHACFCPACKKRFEAFLGRSVKGWPAAAISGKESQEYQNWRCAHMTEFVRQVRKTLRAIDPKLKLSAAVYQNYPDSRASVGQDWGLWLKTDLVDFVVPMNYTESSVEFSSVVQNQIKLPGAKRRVIPGIGVTASESRLSPDQVIEQILSLRSLNCKGFVLFDLNAALAEETLPLLKQGVTAE